MQIFTVGLYKKEVDFLLPYVFNVFKELTSLPSFAGFSILAVLAHRVCSVKTVEKTVVKTVGKRERKYCRCRLFFLF
jgi:hypothetical protein